MDKSYIDLNIEHYIGFGKLTKVSREINIAFNRFGTDYITLTELAELAKNNTVLTQTFKVEAKKKKSNGETVINLAKILRGRKFRSFIKTLDILDPNGDTRAAIENIKIDIYRDDLIENGAWYPFWIPYAEAAGGYFYLDFASSGKKYTVYNSYLINLDDLPGYGTKAKEEEVYIGKFDDKKGNLNNIKIRFTLINN